MQTKKAMHNDGTIVVAKTSIELDVPNAEPTFGSDALAWPRF
jgi:hypothetical protein